MHLGSKLRKLGLALGLPDPGLNPSGDMEEGFYNGYVFSLVFRFVVPGGYTVTYLAISSLVGPSSL
jgi:hypothetical protein